MNRSVRDAFLAVVLVGFLYGIAYLMLGGDEGTKIRSARLYLASQQERLGPYNDYDWAWKPTPALEFPDLKKYLEAPPPNMASDTLYYLGSNKGFTLFYVIGKKKIWIDSKLDGVKVGPADY